MQALPTSLRSDVPADRALVLFDGVCNLCNGFVQFVLRRDPQGRVAFASLQSELGQTVLQALDLPTAQLGTVLLIEDGRVYQRSDVPLRLSRHLSGAWPLVCHLRLLPRFLRDRVYDFVARHRYRWFGKQDQCMLPRPEWRARFVGE